MSRYCFVQEGVTANCTQTVRHDICVVISRQFFTRIFVKHQIENILYNESIYMLVQSLFHLRPVVRSLFKLILSCSRSSSLYETGINFGEINSLVDSMFLDVRSTFLSRFL